MSTTIQVTNIETGEVRDFSGVMMVAPNGMVFIKQGKEVVWCSASTNLKHDTKNKLKSPPN